MISSRSTATPPVAAATQPAPRRPRPANRRLSLLVVLGLVANTALATAAAAGEEAVPLEGARQSTDVERVILEEFEEMRRQGGSCGGATYPPNPTPLPVSVDLSRMAYLYTGHWVLAGGLKPPKTLGQIAIDEGIAVESYTGGFLTGWHQGYYAREKILDDLLERISNDINHQERCKIIMGDPAYENYRLGIGAAAAENAEDLGWGRKGARSEKVRIFAGIPFKYNFTTSPRNVTETAYRNVMEYRYWNGSRWALKLNGGSFVHLAESNNGDWNQSFSSDVIHYRTWDGGRWEARLEGGQFVHVSEDQPGLVRRSDHLKYVDWHGQQWVARLEGSL